MEALSLADLPAEALQIATSYLNDSLVRLWLCGNKRLNSRLSIGAGIAEVSLRSIGKFNISCYPRFLDNLVFLSKLSIIRGSSRLCGAKALWKHLSHLCRLKELALSCEEAEEWLISPIDGSGSFSGAADELGAQTHVSRLNPMASTFPHLQRLELTASKPCLVETDLIFFPETLTRIHLWSNPSISPQSYKHFRGNGLASIVSLEPHLESEEALYNCPPSLTSLFRSDWQPLVLTKPFPLALECFSTSIKLESLPYLPNSLTRLRLKWYLSVVFPPLNAQILPNLRDLLIEGAANLVFGEPLEFPPSLTQLVVTPTLSCSDDFEPLLKPLPLGLKVLEMKLGTNMSWEKIQTAMPPNIEEITLTQQNEAFGGTILLNLPKTLRKLIVHNTTTLYHNGRAKEPISINEAMKFSSFHSALRHLSISKSGPMNGEYFSLLPRGLLSLSCQVGSNFNKTTLNFLPNLSSLHVLCSRLAPAKLIVEDIACLPLSLVDLMLVGESMTIAWTTSEISVLPPYLSKLAIHASHIQDEAINFLPRSLTDLSISCATAPTSKAWIDFPRELSTLELTTSCKVDEQDVKHLPRFIKYLYMPNSRLSPTCLQDMPPYLSQVLASSPEFMKAFRMATNGEPWPTHNITAPV